MKKILALAAVAALTAGVSAYAANPFSDVSTDDWAYQAVADLSEQGVVEGYPDGTFKGERNMTRYELAQIVARLMAKEDQLNAEQQATLDKLAGEYADELANLGVRVSNLEKKVGNIAWSGNARMRYMTRDNAGKDAKWDGRIRLNVKGQVNEDTYVQGRFLNNMNFKDSGDSNTTMDRIFVHHDFDKVGVTIGRYEADFGNITNGCWLYSGILDGAEAQAKLGKLSLNAGFGKFKENDASKTGVGDYLSTDKDGNKTYERKDAFYAQGKTDFGFAKVGVDYIKFHEKGAEILGGNVNVPVAKNVEVFGDYYVNTDAKGAGEAWQAGLGYSNFNKKKVGTFDLNVAYFHVMDDIYQGGTGTQVGDLLDNISGKHTFWLATGDLVLQNNVFLRAEYAFADSAKDAGQKDADDAWAVSLNYAF